MPSNSFRSSDKNFGTLTSLMARKQISSCKKMNSILSDIYFNFLQLYQANAGNKHLMT